MVQTALQAGEVKAIPKGLEVAVETGHVSIANLVAQQIPSDEAVETEFVIYAGVQREQQRNVISSWYARRGRCQESTSDRVTARR